MGRTTDSEETRKRFLDKVREAGYSIDASLKSRNSEVYRIFKNGSQWIIFLKISTLKHGDCFWGVNKVLFDFFALYEKKGNILKIKDEDLQDKAVREIVEGLRKILTGQDEKLLIVFCQSFKKEPRGYVLSAKDFRKISVAFSSSLEDYKIHEKELKNHKCKDFLDIGALFDGTE